MSCEFSPSVFFIPGSRLKEQPLFGHAILVAEEKSQRADEDMQWLLKHLLTYLCQRQVTQPSSSSMSMGQGCILLHRRPASHMVEGRVYNPLTGKGSESWEQ